MGVWEGGSMGGWPQHTMGSEAVAHVPPARSISYSIANSKANCIFRNLDVLKNTTSMHFDSVILEYKNCKCNPFSKHQLFCGIRTRHPNAGNQQLYLWAAPLSLEVWTWNSWLYSQRPFSFHFQRVLKWTLKPFEPLNLLNPWTIQTLEPLNCLNPWSKPFDHLYPFKHLNP